MDGNFLYFFIAYKRNIKENDISFILHEKNEPKPVSIYVDEHYEKKFYYYNKIFKISKSSGKGEKRNNYTFELKINDEKYFIKFDSKGRTFVYDASIETKEKIVAISQKKEYYEIFEIFIKALEKNGEKSIIDDLYRESIELYEIQKGFSFLIVLFLKIYRKKEMCLQLLNIFKKMNENSRYNENMDRKDFLKDYISKFKLIISEADEIIINNRYNLIEFYGIILCYLNYYDYETFSSVLNDLCAKKPEDLYEILLIYYGHLQDYQINKNFEFLNNFISYTIANKNFQYLYRGLYYIKDPETFLYIIEKNKNEIFERYNFHKKKNIIRFYHLEFKDMEDEPQIEIETKGTASQNNIENTKELFTEDINHNTKTKRKSRFEMINNIKSIIKFCKDKNTFLIDFKFNLWQSLLKYHEEPTQDNIEICFKLRELYKEYYDLVNKVFDKKDIIFSYIRRETINYFYHDEFGFLLDQIIQKYIDNNKELSNIKKLNIIVKYHPYYKDPIYSNKIDCHIFDSFDFSQIDNEFIEYFKNMGFEIIFKYNIEKYIKKLLEKIKDISNFEPIIKLFNIKNVIDKNIFLEQLNKRYDMLLSNEIGKLTNEKFKEAVHIVAKLSIINYIYEPQEKKEKKLEFINRRVKGRLDKKITLLIFIEIINLILNKGNKEEEEEYTHIDFNDLKTFIFDEFSKKLEDNNDIENIMKLIDCLEGKNEKGQINNQIINEKSNDDYKNINEFLAKLIENNLFTKDDFFLEKQDNRILLLCELYEKGKIKKSQEEYFDKITNLLNCIKKDIDGEIKISNLKEFLKIDKSLAIQRLKLFKLILGEFNPEDKYEELKNK